MKFLIEQRGDRFFCILSNKSETWKHECGYSSFKRKCVENHQLALIVNKKNIYSAPIHMIKGVAHFETSLDQFFEGK